MLTLTQNGAVSIAGVGVVELNEALAVVLYLRIQAAEPDFEITPDMHRVYAKALEIVGTVATDLVWEQTKISKSA